MNRVSESRFQEIVSSYLDGEATKEELSLLVSLIRENPDLAKIFYENCRIYLATCKIYGKEAKLAPLPYCFQDETPTCNTVPFSKVVFEWSLVFLLMLTSAIFFYLSQRDAESNFNIEQKSLEYSSKLYDVKVGKQMSGNSNVCGFIQFSTKAKIIKIDEKEMPEKAEKAEAGKEK